MNQFSELLKNLRIKRRLTLRACAADLGVDPSNWSKIERGINPAPKDVETLKAWAHYFKLEYDDAMSFFDAAALSRREVPDYIASDKEIMDKLPAFFRSLRDCDTRDEKLEEFIEDLRALHSPGLRNKGRRAR
jgi:transcriptional regulator with XRE-family HTH domain